MNKRNFIISFLVVILSPVISVGIYSFISVVVSKDEKSGKTWIEKVDEITTTSNYSGAIVLEKIESSKNYPKEPRKYYITAKKYRCNGRWRVFKIRVTKFEYIKFNPGDTLK